MCIRDRDFAIRAGAVPNAWAANSTVALETGNSKTACAKEKGAKYARTAVIDNVYSSSSIFPHCSTRSNKKQPTATQDSSYNLQAPKILL